MDEDAIALINGRIAELDSIVAAITADIDAATTRRQVYQDELDGLEASLTKLGV